MSYLPQTASSTANGALQLSSSFSVIADKLINVMRGSWINLGATSGTNVASLAITNLSASYSRYLIVGSNILGSGVLTLEYSIDNGATYLSSGYKSIFNTSATTRIEGVDLDATTYLTYCQITLFNPGSSTTYKECLISQFRSGGGTAVAYQNIQGINTSTTSPINAIRIKASGSNITAGFNLYGLLAM